MPPCGLKCYHLPSILFNIMVHYRREENWKFHYCNFLAILVISLRWGQRSPWWEPYKLCNSCQDYPGLYVYQGFFLKYKFKTWNERSHPLWESASNILQQKWNKLLGSTFSLFKPVLYFFTYVIYVKYVTEMSLQLAVNGRNLSSIRRSGLLKKNTSKQTNEQK